jgi:HEAT repeat protein
VEVVSFGPQDSGIGLRAAGAVLLANLRPPGALLELGALLFDSSNNGGAEARHKAPVRLAAAKAIGQLGDPAGAALLVVKLSGAGAALGLADVAGHPGLLDDAEILGECMDALVALQEPRTLEFLKPWLSAPDPYLVATAATGIAQVGKAAAVPLLVQALAEAPLAAKEPLVYALAAVRADEGRAALALLAEDRDPVVRRLARELL